MPLGRKGTCVCGIPTFSSPPPCTRSKPTTTSPQRNICSRPSFVTRPRITGRSAVPSSHSQASARPPLRYPPHPTRTPRCTRRLFSSTTNQSTCLPLPTLFDIPALHSLAPLLYSPFRQVHPDRGGLRRRRRGPPLRYPGRPLGPLRSDQAFHQPPRGLARVSAVRRLSDGSFHERDRLRRGADAARKAQADDHPARRDAPGMPAHALASRDTALTTPTQRHLLSLAMRSPRCNCAAECRATPSPTPTRPTKHHNSDTPRTFLASSALHYSSLPAFCPPIQHPSPPFPRLLCASRPLGADRRTKRNPALHLRPPGCIRPRLVRPLRRRGLRRLHAKGHH
jgi:hypothetical protein